MRDTCIDGTFTGWTGDTLFELCNGELWLQASYDYTYHYAYRPDAQIVLYLGSYYLFVEGVDDLVAVTQVTDYISSCISSDFDGWDGDTVFELCNGQVWQQAEYNYRYHYAYRPVVIIYWSGYQYLMKVDGIDDALAVSQIY